jgi:hypothetical protein
MLGAGVLLCVLSIPVGIMPRPILGKVMPGRLKPERLGRLNLLESATGAAAAGGVGVADGVKAAVAFCFKKDEKLPMLPAVSETGLDWI